MGGSRLDQAVFARARSFHFREAAMASNSIQQSVPFEKRLAEAKRILEKYPDRVPVICERAPRSTLPEIEKKKFLVPGTMLCGEFKYIIHKHLNQSIGESVPSDQTIYLSWAPLRPRRARCCPSSTTS